MNLIYNYDVRCSHHFNNIRNAIFRAIIIRFQLSSIDDLDHLSYTAFEKARFDLRQETNVMLSIDNDLRLMMANIGHISDFIQFPVNVRVLHPYNSESYRRKAYNVDVIHCDPWSGSPPDSNNIFLYLRTSTYSPHLEHYYVPHNERSLIYNYRGSYSNAPRFTHIPYANIPFSGQLQIFSASVPHKITRQHLGVTVSIDFRVRNISQFFFNDLYYRPSRDWYESKMTSLGVYWSWSTNYPSSIDQKIISEKIHAASISSRYEDIRKEYTKRFYADY